MSDAPVVTVQEWLEGVLASAGARAGSVHHERGGDLYLTAAVAIPEAVLDRVRHVPHGKGMAGLAQVRREPVQTCNLLTDDTGRINPVARLVGGGAAAAIPVFRPRAEVYAVVGFAFEAEGEIPPERMRALQFKASRASAGARANGRASSSRRARFSACSI